MAHVPGERPAGQLEQFVRLSSQFDETCSVDEDAGDWEGSCKEYDEAELDDELQLFFVAIIRDGQAAGEIDPELDAEFLADMWVGLLTVTAHDWVNRGQRSNLSADLTNRFGTLFRGIEK